MCNIKILLNLIDLNHLSVNKSAQKIKAADTFTQHCAFTRSHPQTLCADHS